MAENVFFLDWFHPTAGNGKTMIIHMSIHVPGLYLTKINIVHTYDTI